MSRIIGILLLSVCFGGMAFAADPAVDDGMAPHLEELFDPNAQADRIVERHSQQMSLKAERARIDMKQSAPNRAKQGAPTRHVPTASVKPGKPRPDPPKPGPPRPAPPTPAKPAPAPK